jgi:26S proteasome regulatory subunit N8
MIGWYHSGPKLRASDQEINDLFKQFIPRPVMVIVNVRQRDESIPTDAYFAVEKIKDVSTADTYKNQTGPLICPYLGWN